MTEKIVGWDVKNQNKIFEESFVKANSIGLDEIPHYGAFCLVLHCLPMYTLYTGLKFR